MPSWPEVADTAVKVGLGALITAVGTYRLTRLQVGAQTHREETQRRQQEWARVLQLVTGFRKGLLRFHEAAGDYGVNRGDARLEPALDEGFEAARADLETALLDLVEAHTLLSLRDEASAAALEEFRMAADCYFRDIWNSRDTFSDESRLEAWERLEAPRQVFFTHLKRLSEPALS